MARGGLYKSDVQKARRSLLAQSKHPSVDAVRVALGNTGSKTTIHRYLKELEEEEGGGAGARVAVSDAVQDLVQRLAAQLHQEADARIAEAQAEHAAVLRARDEALVLARQEAAGLSSQLQLIDGALAAEREAHAAAQRALQDGRVTISQLEERSAGLTRRLSEQETHIASLEQKHQQARDALEHFRTAAKEQRDQEHRRHEHQVQALQVELRQAQEALTGKNHELMQLNRDNARMTEQLGQQGKEIRQAHTDERLLRQQLDELKGIAQEYHVLDARRSQELLAMEQLRAELTSSQKEGESQRDARRQADAEVVGLNARLHTLESVLAQLRPVAVADTAR